MDCKAVVLQGQTAAMLSGFKQEKNFVQGSTDTT